MPRFNWKLGKLGVLGINGRNLDYVFTSNPRKYYPLVDHKLKTKQIAASIGIPCPELYGVISSQSQIKHLDDIIGGRAQFAIKPAQGSGGGGIVVIVGRTPSGYIRSSGSVMKREELEYHLSNILSGLYSLGGVNDEAIIEYRVRTSSIFNNIIFQGVPDIRIICYQGVPAMAMLRLPTRESDGKANLHMGGIGVGVDMGTGTTVYGVHRGSLVSLHPETGFPIGGIQLPNWDYILTMAALFDKVLGMRYIGVDIVLDEEKGPMLLEINARPGLAIQIANQEGIKPRLELIKKHANDLKSIEEKVAFARANFAVKDLGAATNPVQGAA